MKNLLYLSFLAILFSCNNNRNINDVKNIKDDLEEHREEVYYICNGRYSKRYHLDENCLGLSNCSTEISKVSFDEINRKGRTLCGFED
tara:strand:- start:1018 stop:1281 length:264 start_codon:yes stop_codon:yes gene_type:complete